MPIWISWLKWFSFATYGYCGLLVNEFSGRDIPCAADTVFESGDLNACPLSGDAALKSLGITGLLSEIWFNALMLVVCQVFCRTAHLIIVTKIRSDGFVNTII